MDHQHQSWIWNTMKCQLLTMNMQPTELKILDVYIIFHHQWHLVKMIDPRSSIQRRSLYVFSSLYSRHEITRHNLNQNSFISFHFLTNQIVIDSLHQKMPSTHIRSTLTIDYMVCLGSLSKINDFELESYHGSSFCICRKSSCSIVSVTELPVWRCIYHLPK